MDAVIGQLIRIWHDRRLAWGLPVVTFLATLLLGADFGRAPLRVTQFFFASAVAAAVAAIWHYSHRIPRVAEDRVGIVVAIAGDDETHDEQLRVDFTTSLAQLLEADDTLTQFQLVVFPRFLAQRCDTLHGALKYLTRARGHFMIFGTVRRRQIDGKRSHYLDLQGVVGHAPIPLPIGAQLAADFQVALPRTVVIPENNDAIIFALTSGLTDIAARYVIGLAAMVSGDLVYAETLLLSTETKLKTTPLRGELVRTLSKALPPRIIALYTNWLDALAGAYIQTRKQEYLQRADDIAKRLLARSPDNYKGLLVAAMAEFVLRKDIGTAKHHLRACKGVEDVSWHFSLAFLYAFEGRMRDARDEYHKAFAGPMDDVSIPVQCEDFLQLILEGYPDKGQLHFAAALINEFAKPDLAVAAREYQLFLAHAASATFPDEVELTKAALVRLQLTDPNGTAS